MVCLGIQSFNDMPRLFSSNFGGIFRSKVRYGLLILSLSIVELHILVQFSFDFLLFLSGDVFALFSVLLDLVCIGWLVVGSVVFGMIVGWAPCYVNFIVLASTRIYCRIDFVVKSVDPMRR